MAHIKLPEGLPGIRGMLVGFPETGKILSSLAETILRGPSSLSMGERELLATYVSFRNGCKFCWMSHGAATVAHLDITQDQLKRRIEQNKDLDGKMTALFAVAESVRSAVQNVPDDQIKAARSAGADDAAIHHTVLIAAAFCMYNRYVDGLKTDAPPSFDMYLEMGQILAKKGYVR